MGFKDTLKSFIRKYHYTKSETDTLLANVDVDTDNLVEKSSTTGLLKNDGTVDTNTYVTSNDSRLSDARTPVSHTHGNLSNDGKIGSDSGKIVTTGTGGSLQASDSITKSMISDFPSSMTPSSHEHNATEIKDSSAYTNIGSSANATQHTINDNINTKLGLKADASSVYSKSDTYTQSEVTTAIANAVSGLQLFEVVSSLPTSNIKDNRLYLIANNESISNNLYDIYLRVNNDWELLDKLEFDISNYYNKTETDTLLNGKVDTSDNRLTNARTPTSHTHGDITNTGAIGSTANLPIITTSNGKLTTGTFGTTSNTFCEGNDSRLSDARTPVSHTHGNLTNDGKIGTDSGKPLITTTGGEVTTGAFGNSGGQFAEGNHTHSNYLTSSNINGMLTVSDIKDNLTSTDTDKPLSAKQGKELKTLVDGKASSSHDHTGVYQPVGNYLTSHQDITGKLNISQTSYKGKNVVVDSTTGDITFENKPTIPSASSSTPSADVSGGAIGSSSNYAKADHQHPLSSAYATSEHNHTGKYVPLNQDRDNAGKFLKVNSMGYVGAESVTIPNTEATTNANGLMSASDKVKLNGIDTGANAYTHPTPSGLGGAKTTGLYKISTDADGHITSATSVTASDILALADISVAEMEVTYTDDSTETIKVLKYTGS